MSEKDPTSLGTSLERVEFGRDFGDMFGDHRKSCFTIAAWLRSVRRRNCLMSFFLITHLWLTHTDSGRLCEVGQYYPAQAGP